MPPQYYLMRVTDEPRVRLDGEPYYEVLGPFDQDPRELTAHLPLPAISTWRVLKDEGLLESTILMRT